MLAENEGLSVIDCHCACTHSHMFSTPLQQPPQPPSHVEARVNVGKSLILDI